MQEQKDLFWAGWIWEVMAETMLQKLKEDVEQHPVSYLQGLDTLAEALFFFARNPVS